MTSDRHHEHPVYDDEPDRDDWDYEHSQWQEPVRAPRAFFMVPFEGDDYDRVSEAADRLGIKLSQFIRDASLEKIARLDAESPPARAAEG